MAGQRGRPAAGAAERRAAAGPRPHHQLALGAQRHREQPGRRPLAAGHQRRPALPARRGGPARGGTAARGPARGRVRDADGTRRQPLAAGPADRAEAVPLCLLSAAAGGVAGVLLARLLAGPGFGRRRTGRRIAAAAVVAAGAMVIMVVPALSTVTPGTARARRGRQAAISRLTRAGADVALVLLAVVAGWQLRHYSAVSAGANGNFGVDPVIVIAPALALAGGTVLALRLLPAGGKAGDRLAARGRRLTAALASWQISRQPIRQGGAALLIVLAVATGTLALAQRQSWTRSDHDQAAFGVGRGRAGGKPASRSRPPRPPRSPAAGGAARHAGRDVRRNGRRRRDPRDRLGPGGERGAAPLRPVAAARGRAVRQDRSRGPAQRGHAARPRGPKSSSPPCSARRRWDWPRPR